jgi:hypothetical protein
MYGFERCFSMFLFVYSSIQFCDMMMWFGYSQFSILAYIILWFEPVILAYGAYLQDNRKFLVHFSSTIIIFISVMIYTFTNLFSPYDRDLFIGETWGNNVGPNNQLIWEGPFEYCGKTVPWSMFKLYLILPWMFMKPKLIGILDCLGALMGFIYSSYYYSNTQEFGSHWCFYSVFYGIFNCFISKLYEKRILTL